MNEKLKVLDLFSGIGGFSLGLERTGGFETVAFCEIEDYPRRVLKKHWPDVPCFEDIRELTKDVLDAKGIVPDIIAGGFPCQDISVAGRQAGIEAERSGLWSEFARLIGEIRPKYAIVENVTNLLSGPSEQRGRWFGRVLGDLAEIGYDAEWHCISAGAVGRPIVRDRVWLITFPHAPGRERLISDDGPFIISVKTHAKRCDSGTYARSFMESGSRDIRPGDGLSVGMERERISQYGNAVVPQIPEMIGRAILEAEKLT